MADAAYLKREVADALVQGLASVVSAEPEDPVEHLGAYLLDYVEAAKRTAEEAARLDQIKVDEREAAVAAAAKAKADKPAQERAAADDRVVANLTKVFAEGKETNGAITSLLGALQRWTGAAGVYVAKRVPGAGGGDDEEEGGGDTAVYTHATDDHSWMVGSTLSKGVTFDAWKLPAVPEPEDGDDDDEDAPKKEVPPPEYPTVHVSQVLHEPRMTMHKMPKLGAFFAVPVVFNSSIHDAAINDADVAAVLEAEAKYAAEDAEKAAAEEAKRAEAEAAASEAKDGEGKDGDDAAAEEAPAEEAPAEEEDEEARAAREAAEKEAADARAEALRPKITTVQVHLAVCMDTVGGSAVDFTADQRASAAAWGKQLAGALEGIEARQALEEWEARKAAVVANKAALENAESDASELKDAEAKAVEEATSALPEDASDEAKAAASAVATAAAHAAAAGKHGEAISGYSARRMAPQGAVRSVLNATLALLGVGAEEAADWARARTHFTEALLKRMGEFDAKTAPSSGGGAAEADAALVNSESVAAGALLGWVQAADAAVAAAAALKAKEEADAAAAAEAEAAAKAAADEAAAADGEGKGDEDEA
mmetsp:Transcript_51009/g.122723  ORF Transcript_51009/g.122723 Transcript_51009/m.122723 type:complete len:597 (+) Transcript_51009:162-1952(+)